MSITAKFIGEFSSFYAAVQKAEVELRSLETGAAKVEKSLNRMVDNFSGRKVIQDATMMATAVEKIGGTSKLTQTELQRVTTVAGEAADKMKRLGIEVPTAVQALANGVKPASALQSAFTGIVGEVGRLAAGFISAQAIIGAVTGAYRTFTEFISTSVSDYLKAEAAQVKLTAALRTQSMLTPEVTRQYDALAKQIQRTTVYDDDLIRAQEALLIQVGNVMPGKMKAALTAATDLASGLGIDLNSATLLVAKAAAGNTETLGRYGVMVSDAALKTEGFDAVLGAIQRRFGGQAQAELETYAGRVKAAANAWSDVKEALGGAIVTHPIVTLALQNVQKAAQDVADGVDRERRSFETFANWTIGPQAVALYRFFTGLAEAQNTFLANERKVNAGMERIRAAGMPAGLPDKTQAGLQEAARITKDETEAARKAKDAREKAAREAIDAAKKQAAEMVALRERMEKANVDIGVKIQRQYHQRIQDDADAGTVFWREFFAHEAKRLEAMFMGPELPDWMAFSPQHAALAPFATAGTGETTMLQTLREIEEQAQATRDALFMGPVLEENTAAARTFGSAFIASARDLPNLLVQAFTGGGGVKGALQAFGTTITMDLFGQGGAFAGALKKAEGGLTKMFGATIGGTLAGAIPGIGAAIGPAIQGLGKLFGKLFGSEAKKVNDLRDAFEDTFGTLDDMARAFKRAGLSVDEFLKIKKVKEFDKAVAELQARMALQEQAVDKVTAAMQKWGLTINDMGPAFQRQELSKAALALYEDFRLLTAEGTNTEAVLRAMSGGFLELVNNARAIGAELPTAFKPLIEQLIQMGLLTDANGVAFQSLEEAGINFGGTIEETFTSMKTAIEEMRDALLLFLGVTKESAKAAGELGREISNIPPYPSGLFGVTGFDGAATGGLATATGIQRFGRGGRVRGWGSDTVPAMLTPGEMVLNANQQHAIGTLLRRGGSDGGGAVTQRIVVQLNSRTIAEEIVPEIPGVLKRRGLAA